MADGSNFASGWEKRVRTNDSSKPSAARRSMSGDQSAKAKQGKKKKVINDKKERNLDRRLSEVKT
jgi:hypothetical protein